MCGIAGFAATSAIKDSEYAQQLYWSLRALFIDVTTRGNDAGGYLGITPAGEVRIAKAVGPLHQLDTLDRDMLESKVFIAHARLATHGDEKDNANNHPFCGDRLALIHNGVVSNYNRFSEHNIGECDSESILRQIEHAPGKTMAKRIRNGIKPLVGTMACALIDITNPDVLYLFRSGGGTSSPLHTIKLPGILLFASTWEMLYRAVLLGKLPAERNIVREDDDQIIVVSGSAQRAQRIKIDAQPGYSSSHWGGYWEEWDYSDYDSGYSHRPVTSSQPKQLGPNLYLFEASNVTQDVPFAHYWMKDQPYIPARSKLNNGGKLILHAGVVKEIY